MSKHRITLADIAKHTGCAVSTVSTWRRGRLPRSLHTLEEISKMFNVSTSYLIGESHIIFSNESPQKHKAQKQIKEIEYNFMKLIAKAEKKKDGLKQLSDLLTKISKEI